MTDRNDLGGRWSRRTLLGAGMCAAVLPTAALADLRIEITGVGANQTPIVICPFMGGEDAPENVADVVGADLTRSGSFRVMAPKSVPTLGNDESLRTALADAAAAGAVALVVGTANVLANGTWDLRMSVYEISTGEVVDSHGIAAQPDQLRMAAHRFADRLYTRYTGEGPMFASRLAYVAQLGRRHYELIITECDGANPRTALRSTEPIISPAWSPEGARIAYVSFEHKKPVVYVHELATGVRRAVATFPGNNSAPAFSPDGRQLAIALSRDGLTQIYLINVDGGNLRRFTRSYGIDTEPTFSADGKWIYFTSDRGGTPQIYRQPVAGGAAERITFGSNYAISPAVSPDGKRIAYVSRLEGRFRLAVMDLSNAQDLLVTHTERDESPAFAPNGRFLVYATEENGRGVLGTCSADARLTTRLVGDGDIREPAWGPVIY